ncbi:MAG TPA: DUF6754 domain-containing protein, partial [Fimbriimonadaceae bacterium]|nr:DUF6754 domain-containing protein [Fimbriimonadaceae bacterium]
MHFIRKCRRPALWACLLFAVAVMLSGCLEVLKYPSLAAYVQARPGQVPVSSMIAATPNQPDVPTFVFWKMRDGSTGVEQVSPNADKDWTITTGNNGDDDFAGAAKAVGIDPATVTPVATGAAVGDQYRDTGWFGILFTYTIVSFFLLNIARAHKRGGNLFIRRIAGLNAIDEAIGRATEMGRPVLMVPGLSGLSATSIQALQIFAYISRTAARFATPIRLCCGDAAVYTVAQEIIRDTYQAEGLLDRYDVDAVRFISDRQFAFAAGVSGVMLREQTAATFFFGDFFAESLIFAETANSVGAIQVASSTQNTQTPFFIAACDYVLIGDEFYAASAYLTRQPVLVGSIVGQDWAKILVLSTCAIAAVWGSVQIGAFKQNMIAMEKKGGIEVPIKGPASFTRNAGDTGNFTCGPIALDPDAVGGTYTFTATDATHFGGVDPTGKALPAGEFGAPYHAGGLGFTISAGSTAAAAGDTFVADVATERPAKA